MKDVDQIIDISMNKIHTYKFKYYRNFRLYHKKKIYFYILFFCWKNKI